MLEENELEKLNFLLGNFVSTNLLEEDGINMDKLKYTEQLLDIFNNNTQTFVVRPYTHKVPLKESIENALLFLGNLDSSYGEYLDTRLKDGTIKFVSIEDAIKCGLPYNSYASYESGKREIYIVYFGEFSDAYTIIHEILHDTNIIPADICDEDNYYLFETRYLFTETISYLGVALACKFFKNVFSNKKELDIEINDCYGGVYYKRYEMDFAINLIKRYVEKTFITNYDIIDITKDKTDNYKSVVGPYLEDVLELDELKIFKNEGYLTAITISNYILDNYKNPEKALLELNKMITQFTPEEIFNYLDLNVNVTDHHYVLRLDEDSVKKLEKSFKNEVKKLY